MFNEFDKITLIGCAMLAISLLSWAAVPASASENGGFFWSAWSAKQTSAKPSPARAVTPTRVKSPEYIKTRAVELSSLPQLPSYTGATSKPNVSIAYDARSTDRPAYDVTFEAREKPEVVASWYRNALQSYGWNLEPEQAGLISGEKNGIRCQVSIDTSAVAGYATQVEVFYR